MPTVPRGRDGFTLVEAMAVLLLFGLVSAAAVPALEAALGPDADDPARALADVYRTARETAASRGAPVLLSVDLRSGAWSLHAAAAPGVPLEESELPAGPDVRREGPGAGTLTARFHASGRSRVPAVSVGSGADARRVEVDPWTSTVSVR